ncbi:MAG: ribbon-helix-helix protein, CopG family [Bryobacteraceae bacterium]
MVLDDEVLHAADRAAHRARTNRSSLIREALRSHLKRLVIQELEHRDRRGYGRKAESGDEMGAWEALAQWPG